MNEATPAIRDVWGKEAPGDTRPGEPLAFESAAQHATTNVPLASPATAVGAVLGSLAGSRYECASHIAVCESGRFLGVATIEALLAAPEESAIALAMDRQAPVVKPGVDQEIAAWHALRNGESALCVVDTDERFVGLIAPHRLLAVLLAER